MFDSIIPSERKSRRGLLRSIAALLLAAAVLGGGGASLAAEEPSPQDLTQVYAAYGALIREKQAVLDVPFTNWDTSAPEARRQTVEILDVWGDDAPELILAEARDLENIYNPLEPLSIYTCQDGQPVLLFEKTITCDYLDGMIMGYILVQTSQDKSLYLYESQGHEGGVTSWSRLSSRGEMTEELLGRDSWSPNFEAESGNTSDFFSDVYYDGSGREISMEEYSAMETKLVESITRVIFSPDLRWYGDPMAMTYDEAVAFLGDAVPAGGDAQAAAAPAAEGEGDALSAYSAFLEQVHHEDDWTYDIGEFWLWDINRDGVPELFTHGGGQMDYTKIFTFRNGRVEYVWWGTTCDVYNNGFIGIGFSGGDGSYRYTVYAVTGECLLYPAFGYVQWLDEGTYSVGLDAADSSERVSAGVMQEALREYVPDGSLCEMSFRENSAANRSGYLFSREGSALSSSPSGGTAAKAEEPPFTITADELAREIDFIRSCYYNPTAEDERITLQNGTDGWNYSRDYTFHNGRLVFAFIFNGTEEHRLYFKDDHMIRYIDEYHTTYDFGSLDPYGDWAERALAEARSLMR